MGWKFYPEHHFDVAWNEHAKLFVYIGTDSTVLKKYFNRKHTVCTGSGYDHNWSEKKKDNTFAPFLGALNIYYL